MDLGQAPSWINVLLAVGAIVFSAGLTVGALQPLRRDVHHQAQRLETLVLLPEQMRTLTATMASLGESLSRLATAREEQIATIVEHKMEIVHLKTEMDRMRLAHHEMRNDWSAFAGRTEARVAFALEEHRREVKGA